MGINVASFYDPNAHIDPETRYQACQYTLSVFHRARVSAHEVETGSPNSFMMGKVGDRVHLVYVRVTLEEEQEERTGPMPGILIDLAREMDAEPHVVRVHLRSTEWGTSIEYFGHDELERAFKSGECWRRKLLGGRTAQGLLRLAGGRLSKLEVRVRQELPGAWPKRPFGDSPDEKLLKEIFGERTEGEEDRNDFPGSVSVGVRVDTLPAEMLGYTICLSQLVRSATESDEHWIFSCSCGSPECAGIWRGVETVHEDGLVVWRIRGIKPRRVVVFEREQYRSEVQSKVREALALHKAMGLRANLGASDRREYVEELLYRAGD